MKLVGLFALGILFILAGLEGNPGSILGSFIDPANMVEGYSWNNQPTTSTSIPLSSVLGGVGPQYV